MSVLYGLAAEFLEPEPLKKAARRAVEEGYRHLDAYAPFPVEELAEAVGFKRDRVALITLLGGLTGCFTGYFMQWYANVIDYPINVAGRPFNSWPAFIPVTFELTVLFASLAGAIGMLALNRLPRPHHPLFNVPEFARASRDRYFLCIEATDPLFELQGTKTFLEGLEAEKVLEVPIEEPHPMAENAEQTHER